MNNNIASVERALDILLLLYGEGKEMGVSQIAGTLGIYKSTVFRTLYTLQEKNFVQKNELTDKYWLGPSLYTIGMMVANSYSLSDIVAPEAEVLCQKVKEVINVSVLHADPINGYRSVVVFKAKGPQQILGVDPQIGSSTTKSFSPRIKGSMLYPLTGIVTCLPVRRISTTFPKSSSLLITSFCINSK